MAPDGGKSVSTKLLSLSSVTRSVGDIPPVPMSEWNICGVISGVLIAEGRWDIEWYCMSMSTSPVTEKRVSSWLECECEGLGWEAVVGGTSRKSWPSGESLDAVLGGVGGVRYRFLTGRSHGGRERGEPFPVGGASSGIWLTDISKCYLRKNMLNGLIRKLTTTKLFQEVTITKPTHIPSAKSSEQADA